MANPLSRILDRCATGFPVMQKVGLTVLGMLYVLSPIDLLPDVIPVLGWGDDAYVLYVLARVWGSPTLKSDQPQG